jgi:asparagine synthase (glutamine-hydrolysing)
MIDAQSHRGPDDWGGWSDDRCALGHRRLSIIDLSEAGRQPMSNARGDVQITFNGEIYNFQQLRRELEGLGHRFRTSTDTEAIIYRLPGQVAWNVRLRNLGSAAAAALSGA